MEDFNNFSKKDDETLYIEDMQGLEEKQEKARENMADLMPKSIGYLRNFHMQLLTISLLTVAIVLPIISSDDQTIFKNTLLSYMGIISISITTILTILYLTYVITNEHKRIDKLYNFYTNSFSEAIKELVVYFQGKKPFNEWRKAYSVLVKINAEKEKDIRKTSKIITEVEVVAWILSGLFILGVLLMGLSIIKF